MKRLLACVTSNGALPGDVSPGEGFGVRSLGSAFVSTPRRGGKRRRTEVRRQKRRRAAALQSEAGYTAQATKGVGRELSGVPPQAIWLMVLRKRCLVTFLGTSSVPSM